MSFLSLGFRSTVATDRVPDACREIWKRLSEAGSGSLRESSNDDDIRAVYEGGKEEQ